MHCWSGKLLAVGCVSSGGAPTPPGTSMFTMSKMCTHMKCKVSIIGDMGMGHLWLNGLGIYELMGGAFGSSKGLKHSED